MRLVPIFLALFLMIAASGCDSPTYSETSAVSPPHSPTAAPPAAISPQTIVSPSAPEKPAAESCRNKDPEHLCIGLKYVAYKSAEGVPTATPAEALQLTLAMNAVWSQCGIAFQLERYQAVDPVEKGLLYNTGGFGDQDAIRAAFDDDIRFVIIATGPWNRGNNTVAWTQAPGGAHYGVVADQGVATDANVMAHELGHYLSLDHVQNPADLMSPVVYPNSNSLDPSQCAAARNSGLNYWPHMSR